MNETTAYRGRLAPAPTGALHLGNARTFLVAWLRARRAGGRLVLRLEDLDHPKVKPHAAEQAYRDLRWLGLDWDEGPETDPTLIQSNRRERYRDLMRFLEDRGLVYPCACTRKELDACLSAPNAGEDTRERRYPGLCRDRFADAREAAAHSGREAGWRFRVRDGRASEFVDGFYGPQRSVLSEWSGDFLIGRGGDAGYQLAVVADDHDMGMTEVVRGADLLPSTHRQLALYEAFGWEAPAFFHVPLVVGPDGRRLAKRHGDSRLSVPREAGHGPGRVLGWLGSSLGIDGGRRELTLAEIGEKCDFSRISREAAVVREDDLAWMGFF